MLKIFLPLLFAANLCCGQFLVTENGIFTDYPFFESAFIKQWKIKSIKGFYQYKKDNDVIRERMKKIEYSFDRNGKIKSKNEQQPSKRGIQMTDVAFRYNRSDLLIAIRKSDPYGFFTLHFEWNEDGKLVKNYQTRLDFNKDNKLEELVWKDSICHEGQKLVYYNDASKAYKEKTLVYDTDENMKSLITKYYRGSTSAYQKTWYNGAGQIIAIEKQEAFAGSKKFRYEYGYDTKGRVETEDYFENGRHIYTRKLSYDSMQGFPELNLIRYHNKKYIDIIKYQLNFFE